MEKTIVVTPSSKAAVLEVFYQAADDKPKKKVEDGQELPCVAGHMLTGLSMYSNWSKKYHLKNFKETPIKLANAKPSSLLEFLSFVPMAVVFFSISSTQCTSAVLIIKLKFWSVLICFR